MASTPCGCDLEEQAERTRDDRARRTLASDAAKHQREWGCPFSNHAHNPPSAACHETLERVERVTGCERGSLRGCPGATRRTHDAARVSMLYSWWLRGQLALVEPHPSQATVDAISAFHDAVESAKADALARLRAEHERAREGGR